MAGTFVYNQPAGTVLNAGQGQTLSATFTPTDTADYTSVTATASINVTPAPIIITAPDATKVYGQPNPPLGPPTGVIIDGHPVTYSTTATTNSFVGSYPITSHFTDSNYSISFVNGTLTVTPALLTITAHNQTKVYGAMLPALTVSYSGFQNGDTMGILTGSPSLMTTADQTSGVGSYTITAAQDSLSAANYTFSFLNGNLTVTPAPLTITANNASKAYGAVIPTLTANYDGFVNGDTAANLTTPPVLTTTATASSNVLSGGYDIAVSGVSDSDYTFNYVDGTLTVNPASLIVNATNKSMTYGGTIPVLTYTYTGLVKNNTSVVFSGSLATTATSSSSVGDYPITQGTLAATGNYTIGTYDPGTLTVNPAPLTITANNATKAYGASLPLLGVSYSGFVNGDTAANLTTHPTLATTATASSHVFTGGYPITASGTSDPDYTFSYQPGTLTITAVPLTITANNAAKMYGAALQVLTASYSGLVNGDTSASLASPPIVSTTASSASHVGSYAINASGASDSDYTITYVPGTLTVIPASLTITANGKMKVYGAGLPTMTASYSGWVNGDSPGSLTAPPTLSTTATAPSHVGSYAITASGAASSDYTISYVGGTLTVTPASLIVTADSKTKVYGSGMPALTASYSGWVNGDQPGSLMTQAALNTTAIASSHVGSYAINVTGAASGDYTISYVGGTLSVTPAPLTITVNNVTKVYGAVIPTLTANYDGFVNGDTAANLTTPPALTTTATASSNVLSGGYDIAVSGASDSDYTFNYVDGTLTVNPASLIVNATNKSMTYGGTIPALTYTYTGLVNNNTSVVFSGSLATTATSSSSVGDYPITMGTLVATGNYMIGTYKPSILTIAKADTIITVTPYGVTYDGNVHNATGTNLTGLVIKSAHTNAGTYTDSWTYTDPWAFTGVVAVALPRSSRASTDTTGRPLVFQATVPGLYPLRAA